MYRTSPIIIKNKPLQGLMTGVLYIIPYIIYNHLMKIMTIKGTFQTRTVIKAHFIDQTMLILHLPLIIKLMSSIFGFSDSSVHSNHHSNHRKCRYVCYWWAVTSSKIKSNTLWTSVVILYFGVKLGWRDVVSFSFWGGLLQKSEKSEYP